AGLRPARRQELRHRSRLADLLRPGAAADAVRTAARTRILARGACHRDRRGAGAGLGRLERARPMAWMAQPDARAAAYAEHHVPSGAIRAARVWDSDAGDQRHMSVGARRPVLFLHLPETAGSTLKNFFKSTLDDFVIQANTADQLAARDPAL